MTEEIATADRLAILWQEISDEVNHGSHPAVILDLVKAYTALFARFQLERAAAGLREDKYYSAARAVEDRSNLLADLYEMEV